MARGPFQGTYVPNIRPTVVTAPDALVFINGEVEVIGCPQCNRFFDFNKYITSVQVDLSIDSVPGSASINLAVPRHSIDDFYFDGVPVITPMMEIEIYAKGFYSLEGLPQYYPIFWGVTTEVNDNYSAGEHTVSIHCADILKWWELCKMNISPAFTAPSGQQGRSLFGNVFYGMNPYDVIWSLALQSYGDVLIGTGTLTSLYKEQAQRPTFDAALSDLMLYWEERFSRIRSNLLLYGVNGSAVRGDSLYQLYSNKNKGTPNKPYASSAVRNANGGTQGGQMVFDPTDPSVVAFRTQGSQVGEVNLWQSEYQTKLELAHAAKEAIGFEFFMDVDGSIVFKPPFYNLDVLANKPISWIQDIDIIDWDLSESESEVVTQIVMQGNYTGNIDWGMPEDITPFSSVTDYHLLRKYGWRSQNLNSEFLANPLTMFYHGLDVLDRLNARRHRGSVSIPLRPELRLGFPIYLAPKDQIWYVTGISHNIAFGSRATTSVTLSARRGKFIAPKGIGTLTFKGFKGNAPTPNQASKNVQLSFPYTSRQLSKGATFDLKVGNAGTLPPTPSQITQGAGVDNPYDPLILRHPKTGRIVGYPNVAMVYTRPFVPADDDLKSIAGQKTTVNPQVAKQNQDLVKRTALQLAQDIDKRFTDTDADRLKDKHVTNRYQYGLNSAGVYIYAYDNSQVAGNETTGVIGEILLLPSTNINVTPTDANAALRSQSALIRPVSDERGFEVIGHFRYGRRVSLRDGRLVLTGNTNTAANVDVPFALGGGLFETLTAQSQGLTSVSSAYANPADAIARMQPEDLQTGGIVNPDTKAPEFTDVGDNFVDTAPLGSPEQQGVPTSVEATQLSRALTLAEMTVKVSKSDPQEDDCPCMIGRADLAFINVGYQVKTLNPASSDNTSIFNQPAQTQTFAPVTVPLPITADQTVTLQSQVTQLQADNTNTEGYIKDAQTKLSAAQSNPNSTPADIQKAQQYVNDLQEHLNQNNAQITTVQGQITDAQSQHSGAGGTPSPQQSELIGRVETFLTNLYKALDKDHQQFESAIRGDLLPGGLLSPNPNQNSNTAQPSEFAPPFSAPGRFAVGDPNATALQGQSNVNNLTNTWNQFGTNLKNAALRGQLTQQIATDQASLQRLNGQLAQLQQQASAGSSVIPSPQSQIASLQQQVTQLTQKIQNEQTQLAQLPAGP